MQLTLSVLRCPDRVVPETRTIQGGELTVGRGPGVDWVLPDPERLLSKRHFAVAYRGGSWQIADISTNGTTINRDPAPLGHGDVRTLRDGDRLQLGAYEIEIRLHEDAVQAGGMRVGDFGAPPPLPLGASPFSDPFAGDPFAPPRPVRNPFDEPASHAAFGMPQTAAQLPHDFDPLAPEPGNAPFLGPIQTDHAHPVDDAFRPPPVIGQAPVHAGGIIPDDALLPEDWEKDLLEGINPPSAPAAPQPALPPTPRPSVQSPGPAKPTANPFDDPFDNAAGPSPAGSPLPEAAFPETAFPESAFPESAFPESAFPESAVPPPPALASAAQPPVTTPGVEAAAPAAAGLALLTAFLEGAGMEDMRSADPAAMLRGVGQAFRALVSGLRAVLIARASIKSEFRIEQTMIRARGNNPLKFSAGDDDALLALLGVGRRVDMPPAAAVAEALDDIRLHELASMAAMQAAVRALLDGLDPVRLRAQAEQGGGLSRLPGQAKARAWDSYEALHQTTVQALSDDFDSVFGKAFARAYERALEDVSARDRR